MKKHFEKQAQELGLSGKAAETFIKAQLSIWEKEQRKKTTLVTLAHSQL